MLGFLYFQQQGVDIAVVEVGLGGRLDSTNIVSPLVSVITSLSMDHMSVLGDSLEKIAFEKAGIVKPGKPVVLSPQKPEARKVVVDICKERHSQLIEIGKQVQFSPLQHSLSGQTFTVWSEENAETDDILQFPLQLSIPLLGYHQVENAATAYGALEVVRKSGFTLSIADYVQGFKNVIWPGRFEVLRVNPPIIIDLAHNRDFALKLANALNDYLPDIPIVLVFGASEDKDVEGMLTELLPRISLVIATQSIHPRALDAETIKTIAENHQMKAMVIKDVTAAFEEALIRAGDSTAVVVTGSLFIAAAIRDHWMKKISTNI